MRTNPSPYTGEFPLHIVARSNNHDWFQIPMAECWQIFSEAIAETEKRFGFETHSFVLMSNHYHWLMSTPKLQLAEGMCYFQSQTSRRIGRAANRINRIYGARYKPTVILKTDHYTNSFRYVYQNPLRAKICARVEQYPWSTFSNSSIRVVERKDFGTQIPVANQLEWLNELPSEEVIEATRSALRRRVFRFPRDKNKFRRKDEANL